MIAWMGETKKRENVNKRTIRPFRNPHIESQLQLLFVDLHIYVFFFDEIRGSCINDVKVKGKRKVIGFLLVSIGRLQPHLNLGGILYSKELYCN